MTFRYHEHTYLLDEGLKEDLSEIARENAVKEAEAEVNKKTRQSGGLERIAAGKTPLEEVKAILEEQNLKSASQVILENAVRNKLRKVAGRDQRLVEGFLKEAEMSERTKDLLYGKRVRKPAAAVAHKASRAAQSVAEHLAPKD